MPAKPVPIEKRVSDLAYQLKGRADRLQYDAFRPINEFKEGAAAKSLDGLSEQIEKLENVNTPAEQKALVDAYAAIKPSVEAQYRGWVNGIEYDEKQWTLNFNPIKQLVLDARWAQLDPAITDLNAFLRVPIPALGGAATQAEIDAHAAKVNKQAALVARVNADLVIAADIKNGARVPPLTPEEKVAKIEALLKSTKEICAEAKNGVDPAAPQLPPNAKLDGLLDGINRVKDETQKAAMTELDRSLKAKNEEQHQKEIRYFRMKHLLNNNFESKLVHAAGRPVPAGRGGILHAGPAEGMQQLEQAMADLKSGGGGLLKVDQTGATIEYRGGSFTLPRMGQTEASKSIFTKRLDAILNVAVLNADTEQTIPPAAPAMPNITYECASKEAVDFQELVFVMSEAAKKGVEVNLGPNVLAKMNNLHPGELAAVTKAIPAAYITGQAAGIEQFLAFQQACNKKAVEVNQARYDQVTAKVAALGKEREFTKIEKQLLSIAPPQILADATHAAAVRDHPAAMVAYNAAVAARNQAIAAGQPGGPVPVAPVAPPAAAPAMPAELAPATAIREEAILRALPEAIQKLKEQIELIQELQAKNMHDPEIQPLRDKVTELKGKIDTAMTNNGIDHTRPAAVPPNPPVTIAERFHEQMAHRGLDTYANVATGLQAIENNIAYAAAHPPMNP